MPRFLQRLGHCLLLVAMVAACGGHWLVLQTVAWSGMVVEFSRTAELRIAVQKTFDGQHPCRLCKAIETGKASEQQRVVQVVVQKAEWIHEPATVLIERAVETAPPQRIADSSAEARAEQPAVPPPRRA